MADNYDDYTRDQLIRLLRERDSKPRFGLVWERDEIDHERAINDDFVALDFDAERSCGDAPYRNLIIEGDNFDALRLRIATRPGDLILDFFAGSETTAHAVMKLNAEDGGDRCYPELLRQALRQCTARSKEVLDAAPLPPEMVVPDNTPRSRLNVYGVIPPDLNETERKFVTMLDADTTGTVLWWHRNEPKKPWSIRIVQANGVPYFPDFVVGVKDRHRHDGILLVETKGQHIVHHEREKVLAEHKVYGSPIMVTPRENGRFMIVRYIPSRDAVEEDRVFRIEGMARY